MSIGVDDLEPEPEPLPEPPAFVPLPVPPFVPLELVFVPLPEPDVAELIAALAREADELLRFVAEYAARPAATAGVR